MENLQRTDAILMEILQEHKTITAFLDVVFGFLRRNTDFYHIQKNESDKVGFPKGVREQILYGAMQRYDPECRLNSLVTQEEDVPQAVEEIELPMTESNAKSTSSPTAVNIKAKTIEDFTAADHKNGSICGNYCWSQTLNDLELQVKLPANLGSARLLDIDIKADRIRVRSRAQPEVVVIDGKVSNKYKYNDAVWTIAERKLHVHLEKAKECWWDKLFVTESCVDGKKIECERYIDELPEESQAAIQKLRHEQMQQDEGTQIQQTNQSELQTMDRLRKAWDVEGSPFKGQPFDPSVVKFS